MSAVMEEEAKRWTTRRKSALVMGIIQGKATVSEASRQFDLAPSELEDWMEPSQGRHGERPAAQTRRCPERTSGLVFTSRSYPKLVRSYGLKQEFIMHCPQQNGMVERVTAH